MCIYPWRLVSKKFKEILEEFKDDNASFHPISIYSEDNNFKEYYILHFVKTIGFDEDGLSKNISAIKNYHFQAFDDSTTGNFFVSELIKHEIMKNKLTGIHFSKL